MSRLAPRATRLIALSAALLLTPALSAQEVRYTRPVPVPEAGWVRMSLDPEILRRAANAGGVLRLFGPDGEEVPFVRVAGDVEGEPVPADVVSVTRAEGGWLVMLELGELGGRRHDRLRLALAGGGAEERPRALSSTLPDVPPTVSFRLDGSEAGTSWELLAVARSGGLLTYPATSVRRLRLWWPEEAGAPRIEEARAWTVPDRALGVTLPRPECRPGAAAAGGPPIGPRTVCPIPLGAAGRSLRRLDLVVASRGTVGFRLHAPREGRWEEIAQGVWSSPFPETPHSLGLAVDLPEPDEPLRLELYGGGEEAPDLVRAAAALGAEALVFRAGRPGRHTLAYGPGVFRSSRAEEEVQAPESVTPLRVEPGAEEAGGPSGGGAPLPASAGPAPSVRFDRRWPVRAEGPASGALHRLSVEAAVYSVARQDLGDLRLLAGDLQVPYVRWRPAEPAAVATIRGGAPEESGTALRLGIDLDVPEIPLSALVIHAPATRFERRVRVFSAAAELPGEEPALRPLTPWLEWSCAPEPPLSCRHSIGLGGGVSAEAGDEPVRRLVLEIDRPATAAARDDLGALDRPERVDLELWRRGDLLLFPWPEGDREVRLVAGAADLEAPGYELADRRAEILARPWRRAEIATEEGAAQDRGWVATATVTVTLVGALLLLLFLLHRILGAAEPAR